jgi:hypothetical protein
MGSDAILADRSRVDNARAVMTPRKMGFPLLRAGIEEGD